MSFVHGKDVIEESRRVRLMVREIDAYFESFGSNVDLTNATSSRAPGGATVLRTDRGKLIGQFESVQLIDFLRRAPGWLIALTEHVRLLEEVAYRNRVEIRRLAKVRRTLEAARNTGLSTPNGRGYVETAIRALYDDPDDR